MNETFEASNGVTVMRNTDDGPDIDYQSWSIGNAREVLLAPHEVDALREFFQHERDQELGRWRDQESPERFVVPGHADDWIQVWNEARMKGEGTYTRSSAVIHFGNPKYPCAATAKRYFDAHPEPKPWHDARDGQLWLIRFSDYPNTDVSALVKNGTFVYNDHCHDGIAAVNDSTITAGRRIWPEVSDA